MVAAPAYGNGGKHLSGWDQAGLAAVMGPGVLPRIMVIKFCSVVVLLQSSIYAGRTAGDGAAESYGISVGSISLAFCIFFTALAKYKPSTFANWVLPKVRGELSATQCFAIFLVAWWGPAAAVLTFFSPFTSTSNGFFATWTAVAMSIFLLSVRGGAAPAPARARAPPPPSLSLPAPAPAPVRFVSS